MEETYGKIHKESFNDKLNKYGYPDTGSNLYADLLPYKDWVKVNNGQRAHQNMVHSNPIFFTSTFVSALAFPRFTAWASLVYLSSRVFYTRCYLSFRGHNKATALEEIMKLELITLVMAAILSSMSIMGVHKLAFVRKITPKRFKK
mmetsp:Transcript_33388/g.51222  ORF Transcript_33388/g.51222 Transcript_33388/m.51222 type:complete len:146 (-) Transcript_33388:12-449(-)